MWLHRRIYMQRITVSEPGMDDAARGGSSGKFAIQFFSRPSRGAHLLSVSFRRPSSLHHAEILFGVLPSTAASMISVAAR